MSPIRRGLLAVLVVTVAGCGSPSAAPSNSPTPNLGAEYEALVAPSNAALDQLSAALGVQPMNGAQIRAAAQNLFNADVTLNTGLLAFEKKVPANEQAHIEAARAALSKEIADLTNVTSSTDDASLTSALLTYEADAQAEGAPFVLLRSDLGLPPPSPRSASPSPST